MEQNKRIGKTVWLAFCLFPLIPIEPYMYIYFVKMQDVKNKLFCLERFLQKKKKIRDKSQKVVAERLSSVYFFSQ